jgi:signal transduction histidine kinase
MIVVAIGEGALVLYIALLSAFLILRRLLGSVAALTAAAEEIREGDLERRIDYKGPQDEVGRLASTFDGMIGQISSAFEAQRQLLADVSHQLRTPLTVIRGHLEVLRRTPCDNPAEVRDTLNLALDALAHTSSLVERLLLLGRSLEADFLATERVDLRSFLGDIVEASRVLAERNFELGSVPDIVILVDRDKLEGALLNLVDNAVKATVPGDSIRIAAAVQKSTADHSGGNTHAGDGRGARLARGKVGDHATEIVISVTDSGHGIQPEARQLVFERFQRSEHPGQPPGGGAGLGLAIVRAVAEAHGGRVELDSLPGEGCTVRIVLPESCREEQAALAAETP